MSEGISPPRPHLLTQRKECERDGRTEEGSRIEERLKEMEGVVAIVHFNYIIFFLLAILVIKKMINRFNRL